MLVFVHRQTHQFLEPGAAHPGGKPFRQTIAAGLFITDFANECQRVVVTSQLVVDLSGLRKQDVKLGEHLGAQDPLVVEVPGCHTNQFSRTLFTLPKPNETARPVFQENLAIEQVESILQRPFATAFVF